MKQILIVEDDFLLRSNLNDLLAANGYKTTIAGSGIEAINCFEKKKFDLVISDLIMPEPDGHQFYEKIKEESGEDSPPFIFLTPETANEISLPAIDPETDECIKMPFNPDELLKTIEKRINRSVAFKLNSDNSKNDFWQNLPENLLDNVLDILGFTEKAIQKADYNNSALYDALIKIKITGLDLHDKIDTIRKYFEMEYYDVSRPVDSFPTSFSITRGFVEQIVESQFANDFKYNELKLNIEPATLQICSKYFGLILTEYIEYFTRYSKIGSFFSINGCIKNNHYKLSIDLKILDNDEIIIYLKNFAASLNKDESKLSQFGIGMLTARRAVANANGYIDFDMTPDCNARLTVFIPLVEINYN